MVEGRRIVMKSPLYQLKSHRYAQIQRSEDQHLKESEWGKKKDDSSTQASQEAEKLLAGDLPAPAPSWPERDRAGRGEPRTWRTEVQFLMRHILG